MSIPNYEVKVIEDSITEHGVRLTTVQLRYPRYIHAELMTHRVFSRNASSSRAIPVVKLADRALEEMVEPIRYGVNQPGMQAGEATLQGDELDMARSIWHRMAETCAQGVKELAALGLHKQWANRPLEWFSTISVIVTSTTFENWDELRRHPDAQPEINHLANLIHEARQASVPVLRKRVRNETSSWHLPYITELERALFSGGSDRPDEPRYLAQVSAARCARVSYLTHEGKTPVIEADLALYNDLVGARPLHASPVEHQGYPLPLATQRSKNFTGWRQHRELVEDSFKK